MFKKILSFNGRIGRLEYWKTLLIIFGFYFLVYLIRDIILYIIIPFLIQKDLIPIINLFDNYFCYIIFRILFVISLIIAIWSRASQGTKRCHDRGNSGWFQFIPFYELWMLFGKGNIGTNKYGEDPKIK